MRRCEEEEHQMQAKRVKRREVVLLKLKISGDIRTSLFQSHFMTTLGFIA